MRSKSLMKINEIPDIFQSKIRLAIMTSLIDGKKDFKQLKELTEATDGNLSTHLSKLEKDGYISSEKTFIQRKPRSTYALTATGRRRFEEYVELLSRLLKS